MDTTHNIHLLCYCTCLEGEVVTGSGQFWVGGLRRNESRGWVQVDIPIVLQEEGCRGYCLRFCKGNRQQRVDAVFKVE